MNCNDEKNTTSIRHFITKCGATVINMKKEMQVRDQKLSSTR